MLLNVLLAYLIGAIVFVILSILQSRLVAPPSSWAALDRDVRTMALLGQNAGGYLCSVYALIAICWPWVLISRIWEATKGHW